MWGVFFFFWFCFFFLSFVFVYVFQVVCVELWKMRTGATRKGGERGRGEQEGKKKEERD